MDLRICPVCTSLQVEQPRRCVWCDWPRPSAGWPPKETLADPWIGRELPGRITVAQRLSSADSLYRATDGSGRSFFAKFCAIHRLATPSDWLTRSKTLKSLRSRHFARFVGAIEFDEYAVFLSDYVEGERLRDRLRRAGQLGVDLSLSIAVQIAVAMESLHALGLEHARLDPRSIVIHNDARGEVRVTVCSFGLAMGVRPEVTAPEYLPPSRRAFGAPGDDIYSIGAILFEMLTGVSPADGMVDADVFDIAPSPLRNPQELNPILHRHRGLDTLVRDLTASEDFRTANISTVVELLEHARLSASKTSAPTGPTQRRPRTFTGPQDTGVGTNATSTRTSRPRTDVRRRAVVPFEGEEHIVRLRGTELKLRTLSGSNRWGPGSIRFDLRDHGISGELECVASTGKTLWFGTSTGVLGMFDANSSTIRQVGAELSGSPLVAVAVREGLVVAGARNGTTLFCAEDGVVRQSAGDRPISHVSVAEHAPRFAVGRADGTVEVRAVDGPDSTMVNEFMLNTVTQIALSVDGKQIALSDQESTVVRDVVTGERLGNFGQFSELISTSDVIRALTTSHSE